MDPKLFKMVILSIFFIEIYLLIRKYSLEVYHKLEINFNKIER